MPILAASLLLIASLIAAALLYQRYCEDRDKRRYTGQGRQIVIAPGQSLYLRERKNTQQDSVEQDGETAADLPLVLFESGIAATHLNWSHIQQAASAFADTASYDRAGLGWSSPARTPRTPTHVARELHALLENASIGPPYILVGHSFGGLAVRRFALLFPEEVAGLVLVDPMRPEEWPPLNPERRQTLDRGIRLTRYAIVFACIGLARLAVTSLLLGSGDASRFLTRRTTGSGRHVLDRIGSEVGKLPDGTRPAIAALWSRPGYFAGMREHLRSIPATVEEMRDARPIDGIPITLITPGSASPLAEEELARIGGNVRQILAPHCAHWVHLDDPDLVIEAVRAMVQATASPVPCAR